MNRLIALDVGERRIGVAFASSAKIAIPLATLTVDAHIYLKIKELLTSHQATKLIVGLPRNSHGEETKQSEFVRKFVTRLQPGVPVVFQDESLTSVTAEERLQATSQSYQKADIDAGAAAIILTDYLESHDE